MMTWEYLAGFTDGEGTIRVPSTSKSITANYSLVQSGNEGHAVLTEIKEFLAAHGINSALLYSPRDSTPRLVKSTRPIWHLGVYRRAHVEFIIRQLLPFLRVKKVVAQDILRFFKLFQPLNQGIALHTLASENVAPRKVPIEIQKARRAITAKRYYDANKPAMLAYKRQWKARKRAADLVLRHKSLYGG